LAAVSGRYLGRKLVQALATIVAIVLLNFVMFRMMPGSPDRALGRNPNLTPEVLAAARARWGLDKPLIPDQLISYIGSTASGDLGYSIFYRGQPVTDVVGASVGPTVLLIGLGEVIAIVVGLFIGAYAGWRRGGLVDRVGNGISLILYSMPYFVIGMPLIIIFAAGLHWFPTSGMLSPAAENGPLGALLVDLARHLVLPLAAVSLGLIGGYSILMRAAVIETRSEDYVTTARAKGLTDSRVLRSHAFPNALLPMVTLIAINLGYVIAGAITAEIVFNWPGLGTLTIDALTARDYPVLQGIFLLVAVSVVLANLLADIVYGFLDPRVRA
jgi:peptide/nickel transport system permease protein